MIEACSCPFAQGQDEITELYCAADESKGVSCWSRPPGRQELPLRTARPAGLDLRATSSMSFDWGAAEAAVTAWEQGDELPAKACGHCGRERGRRDCRSGTPMTAGPRPNALRLQFRGN
eukprot:COSAG02_NODE_1944_length_10307_cov_7.826019_1_plen_119_part_00